MTTTINKYWKSLLVANWSCCVTRLQATCGKYGDQFVNQHEVHQYYCNQHEAYGSKNMLKTIRDITEIQNMLPTEADKSRMILTKVQTSSVGVNQSCDCANCAFVRF